MPQPALDVDPEMQELLTLGRGEADDRTVEQDHVTVDEGCGDLLPPAPLESLPWKRVGILRTEVAVRSGAGHLPVKSLRRQSDWMARWPAW